MSQLRVLVVGASIAGPTTAYWLAKAGAKVTVIERFPKLRTNGQNIDIRTAGVTVMRKMKGMEEAVRAKAVPMEGICIVRENGRPYGTIRATGNPDQQSLVSEYEIYRGDLCKILHDMSNASENVNYIFGEQVASMQQHGSTEDPITVEFANGSPTSDYDLVVACDGATSRTRAMGLGCGVRDYVHPTNLWAAYFSIPGDLLEGNKCGHGHSAKGGRFMAMGPDLDGDTRVTLMGAYPSKDRDALVPFREASKKGDDALKHFVAEFFKDVGWRRAEIVKGMMESDDFYGSENVQVKLPSLYQGRFVLVGDAGYAPGPTGSGTTLALAGAYVLAGEIYKRKGDLAAGLQAYEQRIRPISDDLSKIPALFPAMMAPQTAWGLWLRNDIFAFIAWTGLIEYIQKYFAGAFANTDQYRLPDYDWVA